MQLLHHAREEEPMSYMPHFRNDPSQAQRQSPHHLPYPLYRSLRLPYLASLHPYPHPRQDYRDLELLHHPHPHRPVPVRNRYLNYSRVSIPS